MKENNLGMANLTIEYNNINNNNNSNSIINNTKKTKKSKQTKSKQTKSKHTKSKHTKSKHTNQINTIHQLFIIPINDLLYNKKDDSELLELARVSGNAMFNRLKNNKIVKVNIIDTLDTISNETTYIEAIMEGLLLSSYRFLTYKTENSLTKKKDKFEIKKIHLVLPSYKRDIHKDSIIDKLQKLLNQIKSVFLTRDLINEPANATKINLFITTVKKYIKENNIPIKLKVLDKDDLEKLKMGLILGVGKASLKENEPKIIILEYDGVDSKNKKNSPEYVLLGKGITFDTGGTNLKRGRSLIEMKTDMSGAAVVAIIFTRICYE